MPKSLAWDIKKATQQASRKTQSFRIASTAEKKLHQKAERMFANSGPRIALFLNWSNDWLESLQGTSSSPWR